jgi:hypothetical protein
MQVDLSQAFDAGLEAQRRTTAELQPMNTKSFGLVLNKLAKPWNDVAGEATAAHVRRMMEVKDGPFRSIIGDALEEHAKRRVEDDKSSFDKLASVADNLTACMNTFVKLAEPFSEKNGVWVKAQTPVNGWASGDKPEITGSIVQHCSNLSPDTVQFVQARQENLELKKELEAERATSTRLRKEREDAYADIEELKDEVKEAEANLRLRHQEQIAAFEAKLSERDVQLHRYTQAMLARAELEAKPIAISKNVTFEDEPPPKRKKGLDYIDTDESSKEADDPVLSPTPVVRPTPKEKADLKAEEARELARQIAKAGRREGEAELDSPPDPAPKAVKKKGQPAKGRGKAK